MSLARFTTQSYYGLSNTPEAVILSLALNRIGCIQRWFDIRINEVILSEYIDSSKCKGLVALDILLPVIEKAMKSHTLENVLIVHPSSSMALIKKVVYTIKTKNKVIKCTSEDSRIMEFWHFMKQCQNDNASLPELKPDSGRPSVMIQSSGTTGRPKTIVHSDFSATSAVHSLAYSDVPITEGKTLLNLLPPWIAYGLGEAIHYPLAMGCRVILSPVFDPDAIMPYVGEFTIALAAPFHYRYLCEHFEEIPVGKRRRFFSKVDALVSGGDKISVQENKRFEMVFKCTLVNGYGNNEGWGCLTVNPISDNRYGSVGIPKYGEIVIAYDNENGRELPVGEKGEICVSCNTAFLGYDQNEAETNRVKIKHEDGKIWLHTGDLGSVDSDGFVYLSGSSRRVIVRQGFKISAYTIEDKICEMDEVKECVAVEAPDSQEEHVPDNGDGSRYHLICSADDNENRPRCHNL